MNESIASASSQRAFDASLATAAVLSRAAGEHRMDREGSYAYRPPSTTVTMEPAAPEQAAAREELSLDQITFRRLQSAGEIARIAHLREEIQLPASTLADPVFRSREKKEMKLGSSALSSAVAS